MVIIWSNFAKSNLKDYLSYTKMEHKNAINYIKSLHKYTEALLDNNLLGKDVSYYFSDIPNIRQLIYKQHKILYSINNNEIHIIAIVHTSQNINKIIEDIYKYCRY